MTKFITFAAAAVSAALVSTATIATADSFTYQRTLDDSAILELGTVTASGAGTVEVYDFRGGELGALIGSQDVAAGANANVRVNVNNAPIASVVAILTVNGQQTALREYQIARTSN